MADFFEDFDGMDKDMILESANGLGGGHYVREGEEFLVAYARALGITRSELVAALNKAEGSFSEWWIEAMSMKEKIDLYIEKVDTNDLSNGATNEVEVSSTSEVIQTANQIQNNEEGVSAVLKVIQTANQIQNYEEATNFIHSHQSLALNHTNCDIANAICLMLTRVIDKKEKIAKRMGCFTRLVLRALEKFAAEDCLFVISGTETLVNLLRCLDNQQYFDAQACSLLVNIAETQGMTDAKVAEWTLNVIACYCCANAEGKSRMGTAGACELVARILQQHVSLTSAHNGVAYMAAFVACNLKQNTCHTNKLRLDGADVCGLFQTLVIENPLVTDEKTKKQAQDTIQKISHARILKNALW